MKTDYEIATVLAMTPVERVANGLPVSTGDIAKHFGVGEKKVLTIRHNLSGELNGAVAKIWQKTEEQLRKEIEQFLYIAASKGNPNSAKILAQMKGWLIEKSEVKIGLSADEIARRNLEADRQLREGGYRVEKVQEESPLLPD